MKKELIKISIFIFIFLIVFHFISYLFKPSSYNLRNIGGFYGEKRNSLDIVYLGGSACFVYWEPLKVFEEYGITSYNFAADAIQPEIYQFLTKEVFKYQNPKLILIDARAFQYKDEVVKANDTIANDVSYRNFLTAMPFSYNKYNFIEENVPKYLNENTLSYHFDLIKYHSNRDIYGKDQIKMMIKKYKHPFKGFYFVPDAYRMEKKYQETKKITPISNNTKKILEKLLKYLKRTNQEALFVVSPYIETSKEKEQFNYISTIVKKYNYNFLDTNDYYEEMKVDFDTDFYNYNHMNILGADKYTTFLAKYIIKNYKIKGIGGAKKNKEWEILLKEWNLNIDKTKQEIFNKINSEGYYEKVYIKQ